MLVQDDVRVVHGVVSQECLHRDVLCLWWTCNVAYTYCISSFDPDFIT